MDNRADLAKQAEELGITVDKRWGEGRLRKEIEAAQTQNREVGVKEPIKVGQHVHTFIVPQTLKETASEQLNTVPVEIPQQAVGLPPVQRSVPPLAEYIQEVEAKYVARDVYAVEVTHPNGEERVYPGMYSGIRIKQGPMSVRYSDGTTE